MMTNLNGPFSNVLYGIFSCQGWIWVGVIPFLIGSFPFQPISSTFIGQIPPFLRFLSCVRAAAAAFLPYK